MKKLSLITLALFIAGSTTVTAQRVMTSLVGDAGYGYSGDGGPAQLAKISSPRDVCMDAANNIYFVDAGNDVIRKISATTGIITTVAGGGMSTAEGIPATSAALGGPKYMCIDAYGNLYVSTSSLVRKITPAGIITTAAGNGVTGYTGDGGPATAARLSDPHGVATDPAGNLYIADHANSTIRKVTVSTGIITTIAGDGTSTAYSGEGGPAVSATLSYPVAIAVSNTGNIFFSDEGGSRIRKITASSGVITTYAGGFGGFADGVPATTTTIGMVWGVCVDDTGNLFIDDESCSCRKINNSTGIINRVAGDFFSEGYNGDGSDALFNWFHEPYGLHVDATGSIYVADNFNNRIRKAVQLTHTPSFAYGRGQSITACVSYPSGFDARMAITDLDAGQTETWTVASAPAHGTLSGFPATAVSTGPGALVMPHGLSYTAATGYTGSDVFQVQVSDGTLSETVTVQVIVAGTPVYAGTISGSSTICEGTAMTLSETVTGGTWSASNYRAYVDYGGSVTAYSPGPDSIIYTVTGSCNTATAVFPITILPAIPAGYILGASAVNVGVITPLTESDPGGVWSSSDNTIATVSGSGAVTGVSTGPVTISYTISGIPCDGIATWSMWVGDSATSTQVHTAAVTTEAGITPNPSKGRFSITLPSAVDETVLVTVYSTLGTKVKELPVNTNKAANVELNVPSGVYFINATGAQGKWNGKIIVE